MFDYRESVFEYGKLKPKKALEYRAALIERFTQSPEGQSVIAIQKELVWAAMFLEYLHEELQFDVVELDAVNMEDMLFGIFPEMAFAPPDAAPVIVAEIKAFFQFLQREFEHPYAAACIEALDEIDMIATLHEALDDINAYSEQKTIMLEMVAQGVDLADEASVKRFMDEYAHLHEPIPASYLDVPIPPSMLEEPPKSLDPKVTHAERKKASRRKMAKESRKKNRKRK